MGRVYQRGKTWWVAYYRSGQEFRESCGSARKGDAVQLLHIREGHVAEGRPFSPQALRLRFDDLAEDLLNDYRSRGLRSLERAEESLAHLAGDFAGWRASQITTDAIRAYITRRQGEEAANATINRELAALKRAFNLALKADKLFHRPHVPMLREDNVRCGFFESEMFQRVRAELPDYLYAPVTFAYYTGWRVGEIRRLCWPRVDLTQHEIRLDPGRSKNRQGRVIFVEGELLEILEAMWELRVDGCDYVFHRGGCPIGWYYKAWASACRRACYPGALFHDLRRTAVRNMIRAGVPERVAMEIAGMKTRAIFDRYHIVSEGDLRDAAVRIAAWGGEVAVETLPDTDKKRTMARAGTGVRGLRFWESDVESAS